MKIIKYLVALFGLFSILGGILLLIARTSSYDIETNGKLFIVNKLSKSITVFDLLSGETVIEFPMDIEPHEAITLSSQDKVIVTNYGAPDVIGKSISVINTETYKVESTIDLEESLRPHGIISFPGSNNVAVVTDVGNDLVVVNTETGLIEKKIPTQQVVSHLLVLHPSRPLAYVSNIISSSVSVIDLNLDEVIKIIPCGLGAEGIDITPDGSEIWVANNKENTISIIDTEVNEVVHTIASGKESLRLKFSIDGKYCLATNASDGTISVYDQKFRKHIKTIKFPGKTSLIERVLYHTPRPVGLLMHPNGLYAFVANSNADRIEVINMQTLTIVSTIGTGRVPDGLTFVE